MTTTTVTWKALPDSATLGSVATTALGWLTVLKNHVDSLAANPNMHWVVCSSNLLATPFHVALKPKSGANGRMLFLGNTASLGTTYNAQLFNFTWTAFGLRAAWFPDASSDIPANITVASGDVFTGGATCTGLSPINTVFNADDVLKLYSNEEFLVIKQARPTTVTSYMTLGPAVERYDEEPIHVAGFSTAWADALAATAPSVTLAGFNAKNAGVHYRLANSLNLAFAFNSTRLRNLSTKEAAFLPYFLGSLELGYADLLGYKLRQIYQGPQALASEEILLVNELGVTTEKAFAMTKTATVGPWLVNFKV
jgi:hypothetical protein